MAAHQAPLSLGFSRQEQWSRLPFPTPMHESEKSRVSAGEYQADEQAGVARLRWRVSLLDHFGQIRKIIMGYYYYSSKC